MSASAAVLSGPIYTYLNPRAYVTKNRAYVTKNRDTPH